MLILRRTFLACLLLLAAFGGARTAEPQPLRVLFIGNSYTYGNDLPAMLDELSKAGKQRPLELGRELQGGYTLEKHWQEGKAAKKIAEQPWDVVVLQEHSLRPISERKLMFDYAAKFDEAIKKRGAKTLLYLTWARQGKGETQGALSKAYLDLATDLKAQVAPAGVAWEMALKGDDKLALHQADKSHPTKTGTYLTACVFYGALHGKSPEGLPAKIGGVSDDEAKRLQATAWKAVQGVGGK